MTREITGYRIWAEVEIEFDGGESHENVREATPLCDWVADAGELVRAWNALPLLDADDMLSVRDLQELGAALAEQDPDDDDEEDDDDA